MIHVHQCGCDSGHHQTFDMKIQLGYDDYVLLLIKSDAYYEQDGRYTDLSANTVILYEKKAYIHYGCRHSHYNDDWIHFDMDKDDLSLLSDLSISLNSPHPLNSVDNLSQYIKCIVQEKYSDRPYKDRILDSLMHVLLYTLADDIHTFGKETGSLKYYQNLSSLRTEILGSSHLHWEIEKLARRSGLSVTHFQRLYKAYFGIPCMQDIINARIQKAQFYLKTTDISIQSLAFLCGYDNELHFMRQFKKHTGLTPSEYRLSKR